MRSSDTQCGDVCIEKTNCVSDRALERSRNATWHRIIFTHLQDCSGHVQLQDNPGWTFYCIHDCHRDTFNCTFFCLYHTLDQGNALSFHHRQCGIFFLLMTSFIRWSFLEFPQVISAAQLSSRILRRNFLQQMCYQDVNPFRIYNRQPRIKSNPLDSDFSDSINHVVFDSTITISNCDYHH